MALRGLFFKSKIINHEVPMKTDTCNIKISRYEKTHFNQLNKFFLNCWSPPPLEKSDRWFDWIVQFSPKDPSMQPSVLIACEGDVCCCNDDDDRVNASKKL